METSRTQPRGVAKIPPQDPTSHLHAEPVHYDSHFQVSRPLPNTIFSQQFRQMAAQNRERLEAIRQMQHERDVARKRTRLTPLKNIRLDEVYTDIKGFETSAGTISILNSELPSRQNMQGNPKPLDSFGSPRIAMSPQKPTSQGTLTRDKMVSLQSRWDASPDSSPMQSLLKQLPPAFEALH